MVVLFQHRGDPPRGLSAGLIDRPLRILQVIEATNGGVGRHVLDLCAELIARGHVVHVLYSPTRMKPDFESRMRGMPGLRHFAVPMRRSPHPADALAIGAIYRHVKTHGPFAVLHGHSSKGGAVTRIAALLLGAPAVYTPNAFRTADPTVGPAQRLIYGLTERWLASFGSQTIAVSDDERQQAIDLGFDPQRVHVCLNGLPRRKPSEAVDRAALGIPEDATVIGFVGRLTHQKAPDRILELAVRLEALGLHWVVVGDGPLAAALKSRCGELGLDSRIHWVGARDGYSMMGVFDVFALPSRYEGFAYVLIEALQRGLPIVANDVGGAEHSVVNGSNGFVCEEGDLDAFATALERLGGETGLRRSMAGESARRADLFTLVRMVDRAERVYEAAMTRHAAD